MACLYEILENQNNGFLFASFVYILALWGRLAYQRPLSYVDMAIYRHVNIIAVLGMGKAINHLGRYSRPLRTMH